MNRNVPSRRIAGRRFPAVFAPATILWLAFSLFALFTIPGCGKDEPSKPAATSELSVEAALVPSIIEQGDAATVTLIGALPTSDWSATHATVRVAREPAADGSAPGEVELRVFGRAADAHGQGAAAGSFELATDLPALSEGSWILRVINPDGGVREAPFDVVPRGLWIRYRSFGDRSSADLDLAVNQNGRALVRMEGAPPVMPVTLTAEQMDGLSAAFRTAEFTALNDTYLSDGPAKERVIEIALRTEVARKRVVAEESLMPTALATLEQSLRELTQQLLDQAPPLAPLYGRLAIEPIDGPPGTARHIALTLVNDSDQEITLHFANGLQFDLAIVRPMHGDVGGDPGHMGGMGGGEGGPHMSVLWRLSHLVDPSPDPTSVTIAAHGTTTFEADWSGNTDEGTVVGAGTYECVGRVPAIDRRLPVPPIRLHVQSVSNGLTAQISIEPLSAPAGTARTFTLAVTNPTDQPITVTFLSTQRADFAIDDPRIMAPGPGNVWLSSRGQGFGDVVEDVTWDAHETKTFSATWDGRGNRSRPNAPGMIVPPGVYAGYALLTASSVVGTMPLRVVVER